MKKVKYVVVACLCIALLSFGVVAFANGGTSTDSVNISPKIVTGKFMALVDDDSKIKVSLEAGSETYPLDEAILVLRDKEKSALANIKSGEKLEFAFNSSGRVAFIKAYSEVFLKAEAAALLATPTPVPTLAPIAASVKPVPSPKAAPKVVKPIHKVKAVDPAAAALKDDKDKKNCDGRFADKANDHHQGKNGKHHGWDKHEMKKSS